MFTYLGSAALSLLLPRKLHLISGHPHICIAIRELYCRSHQQIPWGQAAWHKPLIPLIPTQLAREKGEQNWGPVCTVEQRLPVLCEENFSASGVQDLWATTTQSPTDPTQINKCTSRWPKQLLWAFIQNFWCKTFLKRGRKNPRRKSVYFQGKPDKWYTCKEWNSNLYFPLHCFHTGKQRHKWFCLQDIPFTLEYRVPNL